MDLNQLSEAELIDLNRRIVERLRFLRQARAHVAMLEFRIGDRVAFDADAGPVKGILVRYNKKTVSVLTEDGHRWRVAPGLLRPEEKTVVVRNADDNRPTRPALPDHGD